LTYWKNPEDTRSWSAIGYAIRISMELGLHKSAIDTSTEGEKLTLFEKRQKRNKERTWLILFVYDRR
jgi:hypothetical protein